jgi:hypothetical protein
MQAITVTGVFSDSLQNWYTSDNLRRATFFPELIKIVNLAVE